jgi:hypothetical protein
MTKRTRVILVIIICFVIVLGLLYQNMEPSAIAEDIKVDATLQINDTTENTHKEYLMDINIIKSKDCHVIIYPYSQSIGVMTYSTNEKEGYFIPGSIGSDGITERVARTELRKNNFIQDNDEVSFVGFCFPDEAGTYKARIYLDKFDDFSELDNPVLVCVYIEEKFGKQLTWAKVVPVNLGTLDD